MCNNNISPFFILGNPRSGTTLLRLMLDSHPNLLVPPECGFAMWYYNKYNDVDFSDSVASLEEFVTDLKSAKKIETWNLNFLELKDFLHKNNPENYSEVVDLVYRFFGKFKGNKFIWGDKNNFYINYIKEISELFPKSKFIHILRDGRDVACSYKELNKKKIVSSHAPKLNDDISAIAKEWLNNNQKIYSDVQLFVKKDNYIKVRYEDLVTDTESQLRSLTKFLGLKFSQEMLFYYNHSQTHEPQEFMQWKEKTHRAPSAESIGRYKLDLELNEIDSFNSIASSLLRKNQYEI